MSCNRMVVGQIYLAALNALYPQKKYESVNVINMAFSWKMMLINSHLDKQKITFAKIINAVVLQKVHICLNLNTVLTLATNI